LWDRPDDNSAEAKERSRLYNTSTLVTLTIGVIICYLALYAVNLAWALFVLDPAVMGGYLKKPLGYDDLFVLTWFVASAATVGGALGTGPRIGGSNPRGRVLKARGGAPQPPRTRTALDSSRRQVLRHGIVCTQFSHDPSTPFTKCA
jgi:hypothetical protein